MKLNSSATTITLVIDLLLTCIRTFFQDKPSFGYFVKTLLTFPIWVHFVVVVLCAIVTSVTEHKYIRYLNTRHHIVKTIQERGGVVPKVNTDTAVRGATGRSGDITSATPVSANRRYWHDGGV